MTDSDLERRLERLAASYADRSVDTAASWRQFSRMRRQSSVNRRLAAVGAAAAVIVAVTVAGSSVAQRQPGPTPGTGGHVMKSAQSAPITITARITQPGAGSGPGDTSIAGTIVGQRGQVWGIAFAGYLFRIDPRANRVTFREHIAGLSDITTGAGALWVLTKAGGSFGQLLKLDPGTGRLTARFPLTRRCQEVTYGGSQLWLACGSRATDFLRISPATGRVIATAGPAYGVGDVAATPDGIWFTGNSGISGFVGAGTRLRWISVNSSAYPVSFVNIDSFLYGQGALWAMTTDESVAKINPATGRITRTYTYQTYDPSYSMGLDFLTVGLGSLWFINDDHYQATSVLRVSMATGLPQGRVSGVGSCGEPCWQIYVAGGSVWVPTQTHITRIDPVRWEQRG